MNANILPVVRRELKSYFNSPVAYIVVVAFLVFTSVWLFYMQTFFVRDQASLRPFFIVIPVVFVFLLPAITMRSWAEEKKLGTLEVLLTLPFRESELVIGKFLAAFSLLAITLLLTVPIPLMVSRLGSFDGGEILGQYLGVLLLGATGISLGMFVSSFASNQLSAFIIGVLILLFLTLVNQINYLVSLPAWAAGLVNYLSLEGHFESFGKGLIDTRDLFFFLIATSLFLYLNIKSLIFKKWQ
jgi:ABC-2 type transport system permease protein